MAPPPPLSASGTAVCRLLGPFLSAVVGVPMCQAHRVTQGTGSLKEPQESSCLTHFGNGGVKAQRGVMNPCGLEAGLTFGLRLHASEVS